jgi:hypothetical protein
VRTRVLGLNIASSGWFPVNTVITSLTPITAIQISEGIVGSIPGDPFAETYRVTYVQLDGTEYSFLVWGSIDPPFGPEGRFRVEDVDWRCKLKDGTTGPVRSPANEINFSAGGGWSYP